MASIDYKAIVPKKYVSSITASKGLDAFMRDWGADVVNRMQTYPPQQPTVSGYVRTGSYGKGWQMSYLSATRTVTWTNSVQYASYVGGLGGIHQAAEMVRRGWPTLRDVALDVRAKRLPGINLV